MVIWDRYDVARYGVRPTFVDCTMCGGTSSLDNCKHCADTGLDPIPRSEVIAGIRTDYDRFGRPVRR